MYIGEYNHTIDSKGRLILPAKLRESIGDEIVITKGVEGCLFAYDKRSWEEVGEKLNSIPTLTRIELRAVKRKFLAGANEMEVDKQGRFLVPQNLREYAGLDKNVVLAGVGDYIEIWDKEKWDNLYETDVELEMALKQLGNDGYHM